ncbi:Ribbon-helix-helix protein CopG domain-containing protein, partial [Dysosmobacter welbionis]
RPRRMLTHADAKEKESDPPDGALRRPPDPGALLHAGQVAGADAPGPGAAAGAGLRQRPLHRRHSGG